MRDEDDPPRTGAATWRPDLTTYRRRRRAARLVTCVVAVPLLWFGAAMVVILHQGGDTRIGMVAYVAFLVVAGAGGAVLVPMWRRTRAARHAALPLLEDEEPEPGPHLGLSGAVVPPRRW